MLASPAGAGFNLKVALAECTMNEDGMPPGTLLETIMIPHDNPHQQRRETLLTVLLSGLGAGAFLFFLILISDGLILYMVLAVAAVVALGFFHYVVWGYAMTQEVADEQAREAANRQQPADGEMLSDKIQHKRF